MDYGGRLHFFTYTYEPFLLSFNARRQEGILEGLQYNSIGISFWNYTLIFVWFSKYRGVGV